MKRTLLCLSALLCSATSAFAENQYETVDGVTWHFSISDGNVTIGVVDGSSHYPAIAGEYPSELTIPATLGGCPVRTILYNAFYKFSRLTSVTIPEGVTTIDNYAFQDCSNLKSVSIPNSLTSIGAGAFSGCSNDLFDTTTIPGVSLVSGWVVKRGNVSGALDLTGVRGIANKMFDSCALTSVTLSSNMKRIGVDTFLGCTLLTSITIPDGVRSIGSRAFASCTGLKTVKIPNSAKTFGSQAFANCGNITSVEVPGSVQLKSLFSSSYNGLRNVVVSSGTETIPETMFSGCTKLTSVSIPSSVTNIESKAFADCTALDTVRTDDLAAWCHRFYQSADANPLYYAKHFFVNGTEVTDLVVPDGIKTIRGYAFRGFEGLRSLTLPDSVESIGGSAFRGCSNLESANLGNGLKLLGGSSFSICTKLARVSIPATMTRMDPGVFSGCTSITNATFPGRLSSRELFPDSWSGIRTAAFADGTEWVTNSVFEGCTSLTDITVPGSVTNMGSKAFKGCTNLDTVRTDDLKAWCLRFYQSADATPLYYAEHFFVNGNEVRDLVVPDGTKTIRRYAFRGFSGLQSVTLPDSMESIGGGIFKGCMNLGSAKLGTGLKMIGGNAFSDCTSLTTLVVPPKVQTIDSNAFDGATGLETIYLPRRFEGQTDPMSIVPTCTIYFYGDIEALSVPEVWLDRYELTAGGDNIAAAEAVAANGVNKVWECYVAGLDPTNALSRFEARIAMEDGDPVVTWSPDLGSDRVYTVLGATTPGAKESAWTDVTTTPHLGQTDFRFFKVKVSLKEE